MTRIPVSADDIERAFTEGKVTSINIVRRGPKWGDAYVVTVGYGLVGDKNHEYRGMDAHPDLARCLRPLLNYKLKGDPEDLAAQPETAPPAAEETAPPEESDYGDLI